MKLIIEIIIEIPLTRELQLPFLLNQKTRRPASTDIFFAGIQVFCSTFAHSYKRYYCLKSSLRMFSTNINSTTDIFILCTTIRSKIFVSQNQKVSLGNTSVYQKFLGSEKLYASEKGEGVSRFSVENFLSHSAENFRRGESFSDSLILGIEKL